MCAIKLDYIVPYNKPECTRYTGETTSELASSAKLRVQKFFDDNLKRCEYFSPKISDMLDYLILQNV